MSAVDAGRETDPVAALSAFLRVAYSDLVTVIVTSVLTALAALPIVTLGGAILALVDTMQTVVTAEGHGAAPHTERERIRYYTESFRSNLVRGVPFGIVLVAAVGSTLAYTRIAFGTASSPFLVGAVVGLYVVVLLAVWVFRAGSLTVGESEPSGFRESMREAWYHLLAEPAYTALQAILAGVLVVSTAWTRIGLVLLLPGLLGVLEVVSVSELSGDGAADIVFGYRGERGD